MGSVPPQVGVCGPSHSRGEEVFLCLKLDHKQVPSLGTTDESAV
jgi:hypothetical protein